MLCLTYTSMTVVQKKTPAPEVLSRQVWWYWVREVMCYLIQRKLVGKRTKWKLKQLLLFLLLSKLKSVLSWDSNRNSTHRDQLHISSALVTWGNWIKYHVSYTWCYMTENLVQDIQKFLQLATQSSKKPRESRVWCCNMPPHISVRCSICSKHWCLLGFFDGTGASK